MKKLLTLILLLAGLSYAPAYAQTKKGVKQLEKQAKKGDFDAVESLLEIYREGKGEIEKDLEKAKFYANKYMEITIADANDGDLTSLNLLYLIYDDGDDELFVQPDKQKAEYWKIQYDNARKERLKTLKDNVSGLCRKNNLDKVIELIKDAEDEEEADFIYAGVFYAYEERPKADLIFSKLNTPLKEMVINLCSDIVKIHYKLVYFNEINFDNFKMPKQTIEYILAVKQFKENDGFGPFTYYREDDDKIEKLSEEGFAPATFQLARKTQPTNIEDLDFMKRYDKAIELYNKLSTQKFNPDKEYLKKMLDFARNHLHGIQLKPSNGGIYYSYSVDSRIHYLLDFNDNTVRWKNNLPDLLDSYNKNKKREQDAARLEAQYARNMAACKKQYGAKYVEAIQRNDLLPGTPYKLLLEYCDGGRLYRGTFPAGDESVMPRKLIKIYKGSQGLNYTNYTVQINAWVFKVQVRNGIVTWVGSRY